jgi:hypothetical protein
MAEIDDRIVNPTDEEIAQEWEKSQRSGRSENAQLIGTAQPHHVSVGDPQVEIQQTAYERWAAQSEERPALAGLSSHYVGPMFRLTCLC